MDTLLNQAKKGFVASSALYILTGLVLLIWPKVATTLLSILLGAGIIIYGIARIYDYFKDQSAPSALRHDLVIGLVSIFIGIFILSRDFIGQFLPFALGLGVLLNSFVKFQYAFDLKKSGYDSWKITMIFAAVMAVIGLILVFFNIQVSDLFTRLVGISFIIGGGTDIYTLIRMKSQVKKIKKAVTK